MRSRAFTWIARYIAKAWAFLFPAFQSNLEPFQGISLAFAGS